VHKNIADACPQDGISQKLESLIIPAGKGGIFVHIRPVGEGIIQEVDIVKFAGEDAFELLEC
jgi:hypothetical protein